MKALRLIACAIVAITAALVLPAPARAQPAFPQLTGRVVDDAGILDQATISSLTSKLEGLESQTTDQLVVVTLKSLQGLTIEDYGVRLGRFWQIGQMDKNNGVLLIVAPNERKVRIEVGYGLEGALPDAVSKFIIENSILPRFRANDMQDGIWRGADDIVNVLSGNADQWKERATALAPTLFSRTLTSTGNVLSWVPGDILVLFALFLLGSFFSLLSLIWLWIFLPVPIHIGVWLGILPARSLVWLQRRQTGWHFFNFLDGSSSGSSSSGSSSGSWSSGFSGGGGSFGGGGASGSW